MVKCKYLNSLPIYQISSGYASYQDCTEKLCYILPISQNLSDIESIFFISSQQKVLLINLLPYNVKSDCINIHG